MEIIGKLKETNLFPELLEIFDFQCHKRKAFEDPQT